MSFLLTAGRLSTVADGIISIVFALSQLLPEIVPSMGFGAFMVQGSSGQLPVVLSDVLTLVIGGVLIYLAAKKIENRKDNLVIGITIFVLAALFCGYFGILGGLLLILHKFLK